MPPLPQTNDGSLDPVEETTVDSDTDDMENESDIDYSESEDEIGNEEPTTKLLNGTSTSNGNEECSFDADATLPPSPTKTPHTSLIEFISNSSHEMPSSPENERFAHFVGIKCKCYMK